MTGAFLRVQRDGKWQPVKVEHLTPDELREQFKDRSMEEVMRWMNMLCETVREAEKAFTQGEEQP